MNGKSIPSPRFKFLDGLRGVAALLVVLFHQYSLLEIVAPNSFSPFFEFFLSKGYLGVQIFFVLSGFVIAYSVRNSTFDFDFIATFFFKRSIRLDPPYWVSLLLMMSATRLFTLIFSKQDTFLFDSTLILTNFFYLQDFFGLESINPVAWTLCIELQLYMFFVLLLAFIFSLTSIRSISFPLFFMVLFLISLADPFKVSGLFVSYWASFFIGCTVCWTLIGWLSKSWLYGFFGILLLYGFMMQEILILTSLIIAILIHAVGQRKQLITLTLSPLFQYLGKISFSLYLIHWLVSSNCIHFLYKRVGPLNGLKITGIFLLSLFMSIWISHLFYSFIEYPCLLFSQKYRKKELMKSQLTNN